jgi:hypothetical protein
MLVELYQMHDVQKLRSRTVATLDLQEHICTESLKQLASKTFSILPYKEECDRCFIRMRALHSSTQYKQD